LLKVADAAAIENLQKKSIRISSDKKIPLEQSGRRKFKEAAGAYVRDFK
jgi:hypothetical protein